MAITAYWPLISRLRQGGEFFFPRKLFKALSARIERMGLTDYIVMGPKTLIKV